MAIYANDGGARLNLDIGTSMGLNARYQFIPLYTVGPERIGSAAEDINDAITDGALNVGVPLHHFALKDTAAAHRAVENRVTGKALINIGSE